MAVAARAFLDGLTADQLARLHYPDLGDPARTTWSNLPWTLSPRVGVPLGELDDAQQRLLWLLVQRFVGNADFDAAEAQLALIQAGWGDTHFAWQGPPPDASARYYFRVHGPRILIEYDVQEPLTRQGGHVHAITRDPSNDYGMDWLGLHYQESSQQPPGGPGGAARGGGTSTSP